MVARLVVGLCASCLMIVTSVLGLTRPWVVQGLSPVCERQVWSGRIECPPSSTSTVMRTTRSPCGE